MNRRSFISALAALIVMPWRKVFGGKHQVPTVGMSNLCVTNLKRPSILGMSPDEAYIAANRCGKTNTVRGEIEDDLRIRGMFIHSGPEPNETAPFLGDSVETFTYFPYPPEPWAEMKKTVTIRPKTKAQKERLMRLGQSWDKARQDRANQMNRDLFG